MIGGLASALLMLLYVPFALLLKQTTYTQPASYQLADARKVLRRRPVWMMFLYLQCKSRCASKRRHAVGCTA